MTECCTHSFDTGTTYVVEGVLLGERPTRRLAVRTKRKALGVLRVELTDDLSPEAACSTHLSDLHEVVHPDSPEEGQTRSELVYRDTSSDTSLEVFETVSERVSHLDVCRSTSFLHVVARDRDRVELRHILRRVLEDVSDDTHREFGWVDVGVTHHELLEDVILDRTSHLIKLSTLLETCVDIECHDRKYGTIHRHRDGHLVEGDTIEEHLHILQRADRYPSLTDVTDYTRVVSVVPTVGSKVEGYRKTLLTRGKVTAIEGVRLFSRREACILTDRPRTHSVHTAIRTAQVRRNTGSIVEVFHPFEVVRRVDGLDEDLLGGTPYGAVILLRSPFDGASLGKACRLNIYVLELWFHFFCLLTD